MTYSVQTAAPQISTPCVGVCTLDAQGLCMGCFRTTNEIMSWLTYSEGERLSIMAQLEQRKDAYFA